MRKIRRLPGFKSVILMMIFSLFASDVLVSDLNNNNKHSIAPVAAIATAFAIGGTISVGQYGLRCAFLKETWKCDDAVNSFIYGGAFAAVTFGVGLLASFYGGVVTSALAFLGETLDIAETASVGAFTDELVKHINNNFNVGQYICNLSAQDWVEALILSSPNGNATKAVYNQVLPHLDPLFQKLGGQIAKKIKDVQNNDLTLKFDLPNEFSLPHKNDVLLSVSFEKFIDPSLIEYVEFEYSLDKITWLQVPVHYNNTSYPGKDYYGGDGWCAFFGTGKGFANLDYSNTVWLRARAKTKTGLYSAWCEIEKPIKIHNVVFYDLAITNSKTDNLTPLTGDQVKISTTVTNLGSTSIPNGQEIKLIVDGTEEASFSLQNSLEYNQSVIIEFLWTATKGSHSISIESNLPNDQNTVNDKQELFINVKENLSALSLSSDSQILNFDGQSKSIITAKLINEQGLPQVNVDVEFVSYFKNDTSDWTGILNPGSVKTDAFGVAKTSFTPTASGEVTIQAKSGTKRGTVSINVKSVGSSLYTIKLYTVLKQRNELKAEYELNPLITYTSNGIPSEDYLDVVFETDLGQFQNGSKTFTSKLGVGNHGPGRVDIFPLLTSQASGKASISIAVGQTKQIFSHDLFIGNVPVVNAIKTINGITWTEDTEREISWSNDGKYIAVTPGKIFLVSSLMEVYSGPNTGNARSLAFSKSGNKVVLGRTSDNPVFYIYNLINKNLSQYSGPSNAITNSVAWSDQEEGIKLAFASRQPGQFDKIIILTGDSFLQTYLTTGLSSSVIRCIDWKGQYLAAVNDSGYVYLFNTSSNSLLWKKFTGKKELYSVAISPDLNKIAALGRHYSGNNNLHIFSLNSETPIAQFQIGDIGRCYSVDWSPQSDRIVCAADNGYLKIIDPAFGNEIIKLETNTVNPIYGTKWSKQGLIASTTGAIYGPDDFDGPEITILSPKMNEYFETDSVEVTGMVYDLVGIKSLSVKYSNNIEKNINQTDSGLFKVNIPLDSGYQTNIEFKSADIGDRLTTKNISLFRKTKPPLPLLNYPKIDQPNLPKNILFKWFSSGVGLKYRLQVSEGENIGMHVKIDTTIVDTLFQSDNFLPNKKYSWRIGCVNEFGFETYSEIRHFTTQQSVTSIGSDLNLLSVPERYALLQNYPNPFNPLTNIQVQLPHSSFVNIKIYDVIGREIHKITEFYQEKGVYQVSWNATHHSSGVYFYRVEAVDVNNPNNRFIETRKMLLLK